MVTNHPRLNGYTPSEREALDVHKYYLGIERGCEPSLDEVIDSWETHHAMAWRTRKMKRDAEAQLREIELYRQDLVRDRGRQIGFTEAAHEWVSTWGATWRHQREARIDPNV